MRLWHYKLIPFLDRQRLLSQHRECCALRGNGWGKKHSTVDYAFKHAPSKLYEYHCKVMKQMEDEGYEVDAKWHDPLYRGKYVECWTAQDFGNDMSDYDEHDDAYLKECIDLLELKGENVSLMRIKLL